MERFHDKDGNDIYHFMGCSAMSEYTVSAEISCAKITKEMPMENKACLFGCRVSTSLDDILNTSKGEVNLSLDCGCCDEYIIHHEHFL
jgi:Zn-dependent alcohol dehydrogenase